MYRKLPKEIFNPVSDSIRKLESIFPAAVKDGQLDITALKEELGEFEEVGAEKYELTWAGKQAAKKLSQTDVPGRTLKYVPEDSKDADTTQNLYIEGDNLEVLKLLRQNYYGAVKMIYIDPPYNTGRNLIYRNDFSVTEKEYLEVTGELDELGGKMTANLQTNGRFHSTWLSMIYPRLRIAKDLLSDDGFCILAMDDSEIDNLLKICNEVFGEENRLGVVSVKNNPSGRSTTTGMSLAHEYMLVYGKGINSKLGRLARSDEQIARYKENDEIGKYEWVNFRKHGGYRDDAPTMYYPIFVNNDGSSFRIPNVRWNEAKKEYDILDDVMDSEFVAWPIDENGGLRRWKWGLERARNEINEMSVRLDRNKVPSVYIKSRMKDEGMLPLSVWDDKKYSATEAGSNLLSKLMDGKLFDYPKSLYLLMDALVLTTEYNDIILDMFSGSATTAHAVMQLNADDGGNRKFIMVQYPETTDNPEYPTICEIGKERIRRAGEKIKAEVESANAQLKIGEEPKQVPDIGFRVFRTADTNIRWTHEAVMGQMKVDENMLSDKDRLDFMPGYTDIDVVYEVLLRQRDIPLSAKAEKLGIGKRTYMFADAYVVCLDDTVDAELAEALAAIEPTPIKYVLRDSAFDDDISLKDETIRRLEAYIARNSGEQKKAYTVEFI